MPLTARLLSLVALAVLPALGIGAYNEYSSRQAREAEVKEQAVRLANTATGEMRQIVEGVHRVAATLAQITTISDAATGASPPQACADLLVRLRREYPGELDVGIVNRDGRIVCTSGGSVNIGRLTGSHLRRAMDTGGFVVGSYGEAPGGQRFLSFAYPIRSQANEIVGAVVPGLRLPWLADHMQRRFAGQDAVLAISDRNLVYLLRLPQGEPDMVGKASPPEGRGFVAMAGKGAVEITGVDKVSRLAAVASLAISPDSAQQPDLFIATGISRSAAFAPINEATRRVLLLLGLSLILALVAGVVGGRLFVGRPVNRLVAAAARWREGDYTQRAEIAPSQGEFTRLASAFNSMAEQIEARERELRSSEERFRSLASLVPSFIWFADPDGSLQYLNDRWYEYTGQTRDEALPHGWAEALHPDDRDRTLAAWESSRARGVLYEIEIRYRRSDGTYRWFLARAEPMRDESGRTTSWFGSSTDIDAIKQSEQHRTTLIHELNHRVKNTLATVQSLASNSLRAIEPKGARSALEGRLLALSKTHDVLTRENWEGAELHEVVAEVTRPYGEDGKDRFDIDGPILRLRPNTAVPLSMALHELCTNAVKYGALSTAAGRVAITWDVSETAKGRLLRLRWQESGGPDVVVPKHKGFGMRLLEQGIARELDGSVEMHYARSGVTCVIEAPVPTINDAVVIPFSSAS
ncbi:MAG TPA: HWE histidine kinase domain-containing protein [Microvirga sp.]|jgi:PAS domain S-box-containing protein|nr:HWE histidine kinase domain-containing protein [Microvirga sp.]